MCEFCLRSVNTREPKSSGFTLIEVMVVVVIIAVMLAMVPALIPDNRKKILDNESGKLHALIRMAREDAILEGREIALGVWQTGYAFYTPDDSETGWGPLSGGSSEEGGSGSANASALSSRSLPEEMMMSITLEDTEIDLDDEQPEKPQIYLFSTGEFTPFSYRIKTDKYNGKVFSYDALGRLEDEQDVQ